MSYRKQVAVWIGASFLLLAFIGTTQIAWIRQVSDSQRHLVQESLRESLKLGLDEFRFKAWLLMAIFEPDANPGQDRRAENYMQRYHSWHAASMYGSAVKHIFFYDMTARGTGVLSLITGESGKVRRVEWDEGLASVRDHIRRFGFPPGRGLQPNWRETWMFHPRAMAISRPMVTFGPSGRGKTDWPVVTGYLILKLDPDYIRDRLIPDILDHRFDSSSIRDGRYEVTITLDREALYVYEPSATVDTQSPALAGETGGYSLKRLQRTDPTAMARPADQSFRILLSRNPVPEGLAKRGAAQRVFAPGLAIRQQLSDPEFVPAGLLRSAPSEAVKADRGLLRIREQARGLPRLFVAGDKRHTLRIEARQLGSSLREAMNGKYYRSLALGVFALVLLAAAMAMIAITGSRAAQRAETRMEAAASQSHQLLTPISVVIGLADNMIRGSLGNGEKAIQYGEMLRDYGQRLRKIVGRSMQVASIDSSEKRYAREVIDVSKLVTEALDDAGPLFRGAGFDAEHSIAEELPSVQADSEALRQSVDELLSNAVKYGQPGRWVKVETCAAGEGSAREVRIRVHDRGRGIPAREAQRIFEPYYRVPDKFNVSIPGSGLGLKLVREMVSAMGGKLTLDSEEGRGSVFTIHLPASA